MQELVQGAAAFSDFRLKALADSLDEIIPGIKQVSASFVYLLDLDAPLNEAIRARILELLDATDEPLLPGCFFVTPRLGTISPWASKAINILHNCELTAVRRVERGIAFCVKDSAGKSLGPADLAKALDLLYDKMTEGVYENVDNFFYSQPPAPGVVFDLKNGGIDVLHKANAKMGLALSDDEIDYLYQAYSKAGRNPTDSELVMFGQVNSEHCRHKIFNADWVIDGEPQQHTLFQMIKHTHACSPKGTLVAYKDNSSVAQGHLVQAFEINDEGSYNFQEDQIDMIMKVETHNHPTAISPFAGAATGVGGEIRDESATGTGSKSKAGLAGFMVSNLRIPGHIQPWEVEHSKHPARLATPLSIMLDGPLGGASFGNEFGRPQLAGFFRTFEDLVNGRHRGYHKPIMLAGGMGNIRRSQVYKKKLKPGDLIVQLGGPSMRIGLGGGAASSMDTGVNEAALDFDSVQRGNAEVQRRCQEVIDACVTMGDDNPIISIHDVGAGGLSNACPELVEDTGAIFQLRDIPNEEPSMNPMEIWCCEAQERYVLAIDPKDRALFEGLCKRERCPVAFIGVATGDERLVVEDSYFNDRPIDMDIRVLLGKPPKMQRSIQRAEVKPPPLDLEHVAIEDAIYRVLNLPAVADKSFLITITDRSVTGLVHRDQLVGPHQIPIADCAVTATSYLSYKGEAMAMGERSPIALISGPASGRIAIGEALTNLAGANIGEIGNVKLSANWMCACGEDNEDAQLFDTVKAVGMELCPALGVSIPVGKDSLSMRSVWQDESGQNRRQTSPLSLVVSSFAPVQDIRKTVTPDLKPVDSSLVLVDLGAGKNRLGGSALAQVYNQVGDEAPDLDDPAKFKAFWSAIQELVDKGLLLAIHDRSDGGLFITLSEMAMAGGRGFEVTLPGNSTTAKAQLFSEELGVVIQVADREPVLDLLNKHGLLDICFTLGTVKTDNHLIFKSNEGSTLVSTTIADVRRQWSALSYKIRSIRENPACATQEYENATSPDAKGRQYKLTYDLLPKPVNLNLTKPKVAILREQGVNGHVEMAAAYTSVGFDAVDVHMTDLLAGRINLDGFTGLTVCGGFSYGDVLGAGTGWARSILFNPAMKAMFTRFFARQDTFTLGVCNGCQTISQLKSIIDGAAHWPRFMANVSGQFEARYSTVKIMPSPSVLLRGMEGARIPVPSAHGEGLVTFASDEDKKAALAAVCYVDNDGNCTQQYPENPNGSVGGMTGFTTTDGRVLIMMPHPERAFRAVQLAYRPADMFAGEAGPWLRMFQNAYAFATEQ